MNIKKRACITFSLFSFCITVTVALFLVGSGFALNTQEANAVGRAAGRSADQTVIFTNPVPITPADRTSDNPGGDPGLPAGTYPSPLSVSGMIGPITKVVVQFSITSTNPDDLDILLVSPTGKKAIVMSDAGGSGNPANVSYTFDQAASTLLPNDPTTVILPGTFRPSNYFGLDALEPLGRDNFPTAGGLETYPSNFNSFNGDYPNGTWKLYVVDDETGNNVSLPAGWKLTITTTGVAFRSPVDFDGDGRSDYVVVRNTGGPGGQVTWFINNGTGDANSSMALEWGLATDVFFAEDFDGDSKDDIAVWRPGLPTVASFFILNSNGFTARVETFGQTGDDPSVVGDYNNDGKADLAVYRAGAFPGQPSTWYYRTVENGPVTIFGWGLNGDIPVPGDYDGDGNHDFCVHRNNRIWLQTNAAGTFPKQIEFGAPNDVLVPADYDGDGRTDLAVARTVGTGIQWWWRMSDNGSFLGPITFGLSGTDIPTPGDYDGDGKTDLAVWRNGTFWVRGGPEGNAIVQTFRLGVAGDYPVAGFNAH